MHYLHLNNENMQSECKHSTHVYFVYNALKTTIQWYMATKYTYLPIYIILLFSISRYYNIPLREYYSFIYLLIINIPYSRQRIALYRRRDGFTLRGVGASQSCSAIFEKSIYCSINDFFTILRTSIRSKVLRSSDHCSVCTSKSSRAKNNFFIHDILINFRIACTMRGKVQRKLYYVRCLFANFVPKLILFY